MTTTFYRRPLPPTQIPFSSPEGRRLFREALAEGHMEGYFAVAEQFHTQSEPAFCGLGTLVVALNALGVDPGRLWKGPWRWYGEEMLDCCIPLESVRERGLTLAQLACLARCNGARAEVVHASDASAGELRALIASVSASDQAGVLAAAYSRRVLGQTGEGHYSPIAGFHAGRDLALVLDVARFKYPPHWIPVPLLFEAMSAIDLYTGRSRGWVHLTRGASSRPLVMRFIAPGAAWDEVLAELAESLARGAAASPPSSAPEAVALIVRGVPERFLAAVELQDEAPRELAPEHAVRFGETLAALGAQPVLELARAALAGDLPAAWRVHERAAELAALLVLVLPEVLYASFPAEARDALAELRRPDRMPPGLASEVEALRAQLATLHEHFGPSAPACPPR